VTTGLGRDAFFGVAAEAAYGNFVAPTAYVRHRSATPTFEAGTIDDGAVVAGRLVMDEAQVQEGSTTVGATVSLPLLRALPALLLEHMLGEQAAGRAGSTADPHAWTPGSLTGKSLSALIAASTTAGDDLIVALLGAKVASWQVSVPLGEVATLELTLVAQSVDDTQSKPVAAIPLGAAFAGHHATLTVGGSARRARNVTIACENALAADRRFLGSRHISEPLEADARSITWDAELEFDSLADWTAYKGSLARTAVSLALAAGDDNLVFSSPAAVVSASPLPAADARGPLSVSLSMMAYQAAAVPALTVQRWDASI